MIREREKSIPSLTSVRSHLLTLSSHSRKLSEDMNKASGSYGQVLTVIILLFLHYKSSKNYIR